jgi:hypothetical protein
MNYVSGLFSVKTICIALAAAHVLSATLVQAQEGSSFPLVSMEIRVVPEQAVCWLPNGYISGQCPKLDFERDIQSLRGRSVKTTPTPPDQEVSLGNLFDLLGGYRDRLNAQKELSLGQRKAAIFIFDFGESQPKPPFDISINAVQKGQGCRGQDIPERGWSYSSTLPADFRYSFYHVAADTIIPCSSVTWLLTAKDKLSNKTYRWTFKTSR